MTGWFVAGALAILLLITLMVLWVSELQYRHLSDKYKKAKGDLASLDRYRRGENIVYRDPRHSQHSTRRG